MQQQLRREELEVLGRSEEILKGFYLGEENSALFINYSIHKSLYFKKKNLYSQFQTSLELLDRNLNPSFTEFPGLLSFLGKVINKQLYEEKEVIGRGIELFSKYILKLFTSINLGNYNGYLLEVN